MTEELGNRVQKELEEMQKYEYENRIKAWEKEIFNDWEKRKMLLILETIFQREHKGIISHGTLKELMKQHNFKGRRADYLINEIIPLYILKPIKQHTRELHYEKLFIDGKDMLKEAITEMFKYLENSEKEEKETEKKKG